MDEKKQYTKEIRGIRISSLLFNLIYISGVLILVFVDDIGIKIIGLYLALISYYESEMCSRKIAKWNERKKTLNL